MGVMDLIHRKIKDVIFIQFETFTNNPSLTMEKLYSMIGEEYFEHDFDNVKNTAKDPDGYYLNKYPHKGLGKVESRPAEEWRNFFDDEIAREIMQKFPRYNRQFGYI